jgi:hypothetical protein
MRLGIDAPGAAADASAAVLLLAFIRFFLLRAGGKAAIAAEFSLQ